MEKTNLVTLAAGRTKMKLRTLAATATVCAVLVGLLTASPATAVPAGDISISKASLLEVSSDSDQAVRINALVVGVDQSSRTYDERQVDPVVASSEEGIDFKAEFLAQGGTVVEASGLAVYSERPAEVRASAAEARAKGRAWVDGWGFHMTVPKDTMDRLAGLAATGSAGAGGIAALLAANIEGFPVSSVGALAAGAVAVSLIAQAGALQFCNINGKGAQVNFNWVTWTCWPL